MTTQLRDGIRKYLGRIPVADYDRVREKCDRLGISLNAGLTQALRHWIDFVDDKAPVPSNERLSDLVRADLQAMEERLTRAIADPTILLHVPCIDIKTIDPGKEKLANLKLELLGMKPARTREGASMQTLPAVGKRKPLSGQEWVITGSLETMTRDRAREILMELGATVAGTVHNWTAGLVWGPGSGSKVDRAVELGVQLWNERQFIHMIQGMGIDMPLPKASPEQIESTPGSTWTENTGERPAFLHGADVIDIRWLSGTEETMQVGELPGVYWQAVGEDGRSLTHWRYSKPEPVDRRSAE